MKQESNFPNCNEILFLVKPSPMMGEPLEDSDEGYRRKRSVNTSQEEDVRKEEVGLMVKPIAGGGGGR